MIKQLINFVFDLFFPPSCLGCQKAGLFVCEDCFNSIEKTKIQLCPVCRKKSQYGATCSLHKTYLDGLIVVAPYYQNNALVQKMIKRFKYKFNKDLVYYLSKLMVNEIKKYPFLQNATLVPVPLHFLRQWQRGFNQADYLAKSITQNNNNLSVRNLLKRTKYTSKQALLNREQRLKNVINAFTVKNKSNLSTSSNIIIIDDIATTLSTINECAKVLKLNGFKNKIWGMVIARGGGIIEPRIY